MRRAATPAQQGDAVAEGEIFAAIWAHADVAAIATGIYMERYRIGWFSARAALRGDAARSGIDVDTLAEGIVRGLDQRRG